MFRLRNAFLNEVNILTTISKQAFDSDVFVGASEMGGPDNYDNPSWHQQMCKQKHLFSFLKDGEIVGGALLWVSKENVYIGRIFIDPKFFRKGYGIKLMKAIELLYPRKEYVLDTPCWNIRTKNFYLKSGYKIVEEKDGCYFFKKCL